MEMKDGMRYTNDVIAICVFGVSRFYVDSMRNPKNEFYMHSKKVIIFSNLLFLKFYIFRSLPCTNT